MLPKLIQDTDEDNYTVNDLPGELKMDRKKEIMNSVDLLEIKDYKLSDLKTGEEGIITKVVGHGA
ncbi:MAG: hypothetical protein Q8858_14485, partial [Bacteroidota bacterium]|nr:hypothetical protein [Bacteroidota bacterium]